MKAISQVFQKPVWLDNTTDIAVKPLQKGRRLLVLPKASYTEFQRSYKAAATDLPSLIRNELKVLTAADNKAIWKVQGHSNGRYQVLYAVIETSTLHKLPTGWCLCIPETWLLYRFLQKRQLYKVETQNPYWAWLTDDNVLHLTQVQGLMSNATFFLDALGESADGITIEPLSLKQRLDQLPLPLKWWELPGCVVHLTATISKSPTDFKKLATFSGAAIAIYMLVMSAVLVWQESRLQSNVQMLQSEANSLFEQQQVLDQKAELITQYQALYQRFPPAGLMLHELSNQLSTDAVLENVQLSGALVQIRGVSASAISILGKLTNDNNWREVKFDRNIQKVSAGESFTISMVYNGETVDAAGNSNEE